jgi:hypothetical protein
MAADFNAAFVARTELMADGESWAITLVTKAGAAHTITLTAVAAAALSSALADGTTGAAHGLTKRPHNFAVGTGKHQPVVMIRFEKDVPYGLSASQAQILGRELIEASRVASHILEPTRQ